jgi:hypothetical protein
MLRRDFLKASGVVGAATLLPAAGAAGASRSALAVAEDAPTTGFEQRNGASWTTHSEEVAFLEAVAAASPRVRLDQIGTTGNGLPLHLVTLHISTLRQGQAPKGRGRSPKRPDTVAQQGPITLFICSQHGNEPAGRETGLQLLRDLAFTTDEVLVEQLAAQTVLVIPSANPDGRAANTRENAAGVDINRDHLNLTTPEAQAIAAIIRDWSPDLVLDLHEYGPSIPALYDDDILYLWPRNLNADAQVRDLSRTLAEQYIAKGAEAAGYTADEYGLATVGNQTLRVGDDNLNQTAGDEDEGICRNLMGLRHSLGILVESAVTENPRQSPEELVDPATRNRRRVASQVQVTADTLRFMREQGDLAKYASDGAPLRAARSSAPVYFYGADNDPPTPAEIQDPAPLRYDITSADAETLRTVFELHGIRSAPADGGVSVALAQPARPVIPLLLDGRARRGMAEGTPVYG